MKKRKKTQKIYHCKKCDYTSSNKTDFNRHLSTTKHARKQMETFWKHEKLHICSCGKPYKTRGGLFKHKKKCPSIVEKPESSTESLSTDTNLILKAILEENRELRKEMQNIKINQTINNNNQKYNINVFLNEYCKDAMCLEDFMNKLQLTLQDVAKTTQLGFAGGVSNILIKNLNDLPTLDRPIHCSDVKRQKFYVKDKEGWNIDASNQKVDKVIEVVTIKQIKKIKDWERANPDYLTNDVKLKEWQLMIHNLTGPSDDNDRVKETKTIKKNIGENTGIKEAMLTVE